MQLKCKKGLVPCVEKGLCGGNGSEWFAKLRAGGFSLDDALQWGRRVEVDSDQSRYSLRTVRVVPCGR